MDSCGRFGFKNPQDLRNGAGSQSSHSQQGPDSPTVLETLKDGSGGGAYVHGSFDQGPGSSAHFQNCQGWEQGAQAATDLVGLCFKGRFH